MHVVKKKGKESKQKKQKFNQPIISTPHLILFLFRAWNIFTYSYHA